MKKLSRRDMMRGSLAASAAIPLLEINRAYAQDAPRRFVAFETPNGTRNDLFWPSGSDGSLSFPQLTAPFAEIQDKLTFIRGIRHCPAVVGDNGFNGSMNGSEHARGIGGFLTARPLGTGSFQSFMATSGWGSGISLDQHLANEMQPPTTFPTLELGVHVRDAEVRGRISYTGADAPVPPREDPVDVFNALFGELASDSGVGGDMASEGSGDELLDQLRAERRSVFDLTASEITRLQNRLGADDRAKLEQHMESIRNIENRLATPTEGATADDGGGGAAINAGCGAPEGIVETDLLDDNTLPEAARMFADLAAAALACDSTRILTLQYQYAESEHLFPFLGFSRNHHIISHDWQGTQGFEEYGQIHTWIAEQVVYFVKALDAYDEGGSSLLDNTVVFWGSEIGESTSHDLMLMPYVLAGGGSMFNTGRFIDYGTTRHDNNKLLISIAQMVGASGVTEFGDESGEMDTLPDLLT
jgi:hypothetical protein